MKTDRETPPTVFVVGDVHGHLQLALCVAAWQQRVSGVAFDAVLLCGDVGTFTEMAQLDNATRRHARDNPCELEFLTQWASPPEPSWIRRIFLPEAEGGLGLACPVIMTHGNHEGFAAFPPEATAPPPLVPPNACELPTLDAHSRIGYLPSGWTCRLDSGLTVAAAGGIEKGQRRVDYHPLAYIDDEAVLRLAEGPRTNLLITHQGPAAFQGSAGSETLDLLLEAEAARVWFHGHSVRSPEPARLGDGDPLVVPLEDVAFPIRGPRREDPGAEGWATASFGDEIIVHKAPPPFLREFRQRKWGRLPDGRVLSPALFS